MDETMQESQSQDDASVKASSIIETTELQDVDELANDDLNDSSLSLDGTTDQSMQQSLPLPSGYEFDAPLRTAHSSTTSARTTPKSVLPSRKGERKFVGVRVPQPKFKPLPYASSRTGLVFDTRMRHHMDQISSDDDAHPERPQRIFSIWNEIRKAGLLIEDENAEDADQDFKLLRIAVREAEDEELLLVHSREHVDFVKSCETWDLSEIKKRTEVGEGESSIYWHSLTWLCAQLAAGGAIEATRAVAFRLVRNAVAIIRPPGHHAEHDKPGGFCFFDNVAVAARNIQEETKRESEPIRKILILDWDVHHGNGVQQAFYDDPNVLYISLHVYANGEFYPHGDYGDHLHWGSGSAEGKTVNIPWIHQGMRDADYLLAFQQIVMPIASEFDPDLVMISAGFDAAAGDPLGMCFVSPAGYGHMTHMLMQLANGKVVACLEGGYNLQSIAVSALAMTRTLMGEPPERIGELAPSPSAVQTIQNVIETQSRFWNCMHPKVKALDNHRELGSERLHDVVREYQSKTLFESYQMAELKIRRKGLSRTFKDQVLALFNYGEKRPLLVILHDPPEILGIPDPRTSQIELHNTFLDTAAAIVPPDSLRQRQQDCRELALYLWQNYIETGDSTHVIFMGIGDAYNGIAELYKAHPIILKNVTLTVGFLAEHDIRGVSDQEDELVSKTYARNTLILVSSEHPVWDPEGRKLKKRHGNVEKSKRSRLQEMLIYDRDTVLEALADCTAGWKEQLSQDEPVSPIMIDDGVGNDNAMDIDRGRSVANPVWIDGANDGFISQVQTSPMKAGFSTPPVGHFPTAKQATPTRP
ncbi:MAG: hypothetical protein Q9159_004282 [Coniocarpon cinnabarinum]